MLKWIWLSVFVVALDQATKQLAEHMLQFHVPVPVMPMLNMTLSYNEGAAFSFLSNAGGWQRWLFIGLALVVALVLVVWMKKLTRQDKWTAIALAFVLGGAVGNVIDRIIYKHVIDFIQVYYDKWYFPTFNVADMAISVGVVLLLLDGLFGKHQQETAS